MDQQLCAVWRATPSAGTEIKKQVCLLLRFKYLLYKPDLQGGICDII